MRILPYLFFVTLILRPVFPVLNYIINYSYISQELCENKNQPQLNCNGKCHLKKELAKASESNSSSSTEKKNFPAEYDFLSTDKINFFDLKFIGTSPLKNDILAHNLYSYINIDLIFHPPVSPY